MNTRVISTRQGAVSGVVVAGVARWLDIPYAAPPVGENRFRAPQPHENWDGVRDGSQAGPTSPQWTAPFPELDIEPLIGKGWKRGDDFLTVNVWAPDAGATDLPVLVFIHGGAFCLGSNWADAIDGAAFARCGVVCMTVNYRLGVEGFLAIPGAPTNLGLRDQLFALAWIRDNAAAFGGDPSNVTAFGESAGAMSIADLVTSPLAKGLFRRAIIESGHGSMVRPIAVAERITRKLAKILKIKPDVEGFRSKTMEECVEAVKQLQLPTTRIDLRDERKHEPAYGLSRILPVYGDDVLPQRPLEALAKGAGSDIAILIGTNAEEMNLYFVPTGVKDKINRWLAWYLVKRCIPNAWAILKAYGIAQRGRIPGHA
ncbi:MAG: carboxylesterase family protein, partial [Proteobacteria bacterium]|nr:carboxylesterase family protein [Pseudomonadota bacterium]